MAELPQRAKLSDQLISHLAKEIISGRLKLGEPLPPETELATTFGISKIVARESLQTLASLGLVHKQQGKRTVVLDKSEWDALAPAVQRAYWFEGRAAELIRQVYELRVILEPAAAAKAAEEATQEDVKRLLGFLERMQIIADTSKDLQAFLQVDRAFHDTIAAATGNIVLRGLMRNLHVSLSAGWTRSQLAREELAQVTEQHARIASFIKNRNPAGARRAMETHVRWAERIETDRAGRGKRAAVRPARTSDVQVAVGASSF